VSVLAFIEQREGRVRPVAREGVGEAFRLAESLGGPVVGVCPASTDPGLAALGDAGADKVILAANAGFAKYDAAGYARAVAQVAESVKPTAILFPASAMGKDLAPRVAARLGVGLASDCTALAVAEGKLVATRPAGRGRMGRLGEQGPRGRGDRRRRGAGRPHRGRDHRLRRARPAGP
jgi:electron transfer flavoprotein alpha subunit